MAKKKAAEFRCGALSTKQKQVLTWWREGSAFADYNGIIADGAIRSGKTVSMGFSFAEWAMETFNGCNFAICGKTIASLRRNVLKTLMRQLRSRGYKVKERRADNMMVVSKDDVSNDFYLFGGKDEGSQDLIQGITLAGVFLDEVALMPESFVNQATARCSVDGSKFWFNCNPEGPYHWFYRKWILKCRKRKLVYLRFTMEDNLTLTGEIKKRYALQYVGVFFQRFIKGLWVTAEGAIYTPWNDDQKRFIKQVERKDIARAIIGWDFGGNGSASAGVCIGVLKGYKGVAILREYYHKGIITPEKQEAAFVEFARSCKEDYGAVEVRCDSAEQTLIAGFKAAALKAGLRVDIRNAIKGEIINRIRFTLRCMGRGAFFVDPGCKHVQEALSAAVYDSKHVTEDVRLDNGTTNIDSLDAMEYACEPVMDAIIKMSGVN